MTDIESLSNEQFVSLMLLIYTGERQWLTRMDSENYALLMGWCDRGWFRSNGDPRAPIFTMTDAGLAHFLEAIAVRAP